MQVTTTKNDIADGSRPGKKSMKEGHYPTSISSIIGRNGSVTLISFGGTYI